MPFLLGQSPRTEERAGFGGDEWKRTGDVKVARRRTKRKPRAARMFQVGGGIS
jgi:hypothetical protein